MKSVPETCSIHSPDRGLIATCRRGPSVGCGPCEGCGLCYRGMGELLILLLLAGVAGLALLVYAQAEREDLRHNQALATGKLLGTWLHYAHLYTQDLNTIANQQDPTGQVIPKIIEQDDLKTKGYAPDWLQQSSGTDDTIILGIIDDGTPRAGAAPRNGSAPRTGIPMAFVIWNRTTANPKDLPVDFRDSVAEGMSLAEGLNSGQFAAITEYSPDLPTQDIGFTLTHRAKIEALLGITNPTFLVDGKLPFGTILATADTAIAYNTDALYRRRQPGHPELNRMLGDLDLDGNSFTAQTIAITSGKIGDVTVKSQADPTRFGPLVVEGSVTAENAELDSVKGMTLNSVSTRTLKELFVGTLVTDTLEATDITATEGVFETGLNIQNQNPSLSAYKDAFGDIIVSGKTTATNIRATTIKGGTTPSQALPSPGELVTRSDSVTTDQLNTQKATIENTLEITGRCTGC